MLVELHPNGKLFRLGSLLQLKPGRIIHLENDSKKVGCVATSEELTFIVRTKGRHFITMGRGQELLQSQKKLLSNSDSAFFISGALLLTKLGESFPQFNDSVALMLESFEAAVIQAESEKVMVSKLNIATKLYSVSLIGVKGDAMLIL